MSIIVTANRNGGVNSMGRSDSQPEHKPGEEHRIPERVFYRYRSKALFYFPDLPRHIRKLMVSNRHLAERTQGFPDAKVTEGTIRRIADGKGAGFASVKAVFKAVEALYEERRQKTAGQGVAVEPPLDAESELVSAIYVIDGLGAFLNAPGRDVVECANELQMPVWFLTNAAEGRCVSRAMARWMVDRLTHIYGAKASGSLRVDLFDLSSNKAPKTAYEPEGEIAVDPTMDIDRLLLLSREKSAPTP